MRKYRNIGKKVPERKKIRISRLWRRKSGVGGQGEEQAWGNITDRRGRTFF